VAAKRYFDVQKTAMKRLGFPGPGGPLVNSEFYTGWHDYWGRKYDSTPDARVANALGFILSLNASVNMFMFAGGTIYGFRGGTNHGAHSYIYAPATTWDYDSPIGEAGDPRSKLFAIRKGGFQDQVDDESLVTSLAQASSTLYTLQAANYHPAYWQGGGWPPAECLQT
jgi:hypothetical protein